jgi:hypothetical protein
VFAPGKGSFYPEYIPDKYLEKPGPTNYISYISLARKFGINNIDFYSYFINNKNKFKYPIFPKYGVHWSSYAECLVADSLIKYIEHTRNIRIPHIYWHDMKLSSPLFRDADAEDAMNLIFDLKPDTLAYLHYQFESDSGKTRPSALIIADSYFNGIYDMGFLQCFSHSDFWYYNKSVFNDHILGWQLNTDLFHYDKAFFDDCMSLGAP